MDFALQAALLGAVMGSAVLAAATVFAVTLSVAPGAFAWWAAAFVLEAASEGVVMAGGGGGLSLVVQLSDIFHGGASIFLLLGTLGYLGRKVGFGVGAAGPLAVVAWVFAAGWLRDRFGLLPLPIFGIGGLPLLLTAWAFFRRSGGADGAKVAAAAFALGGLHQLAGPLLDAGTVTAVWNLVADQLLSMVAAVALLVVALSHQQALTASEGRRAASLRAWLMDALSGLQDGIAVYDADDRLVTCNDKYRAWLGVCAPMIKPGLTFRDLLEEIARDGVMVGAIGREAEWVEEVMAEHRSCQLIPHERQMWDGRWLSVSVYPTADGGHLRIMSDITGRKQAEAALVESEQRFRDLAESASDWFWEVDAELRFTYVSGKVREVLGVGPSFFLGRSFAELGLACESEGDWVKLRRLMEAWQPFRGFVFPQQLPGGLIKYVEMAGRAITDPAGRPSGYRGTASDITALKGQERELAEQSSLRQAIIDHLGQGVVVFDGPERLVAVNRNARLLLNPSGDGMIPGTTTLEGFLLDLAEQGDLGEGDPAQQVSRRLARARWYPTDTFEYARPDGPALEVRSSAMPGGGLILTFSDITEHKRIEDTLRLAKEAAERGNRAKATFLANISHELRTPLNAIIGFSDLMKQNIFGSISPEPYRSYIDDINESGMHLLELINDILDMSKAEAGMTDLVETEVDVGALVRSSLRMVGRRAGLTQVEFVEELPDDLPPLKADERRLRQIVLNLISNAVKFSDEHGRVTVSARADECGFVLKVEDTGIGMSADELHRVMEPFVQADSRLSRKYEGTGLGLPLAKALVEAHGGRLVLESQPGVGTTATVLLPPERLVRVVA